MQEETQLHIPVLLDEVIDFLQLRPGQIIVDATLGTGGHSLEILKRITPGGKLIAIDRDKDSIEVARARLKSFEGSFELVHGNFSDIDEILWKLGIKEIDGAVFDLGISTFQLKNPERGFSFREEAPLDMRLDKTSYILAYDLINNLNENEISDLLWTFGEERFSRRIAHVIVEERKTHPVSTTKELADLVIKAIPHRYRRSFYRIHPATRTFQAIRIAVNRELEILEGTMRKAIAILRKKARICVISFHSLEDRIIKHTFRQLKSDGLIDIVTPKPLTPGLKEVQANPSSRSSKLRVAERIS